MGRGGAGAFFPKRGRLGRPRIDGPISPARKTGKATAGETLTGRRFLAKMYRYDAPALASGRKKRLPDL